MSIAVLVTGAASGIGHATVERFVAGDATDRVIVIDVDPGVHDLAREKIDMYTADVSDYDAVHAVAEAVERDHDIVAAINNAAVSRYFWLGNLDPTEWRAVLGVNLTGQYNVAHAVGPRMYDREKGAIVNVSSCVDPAVGG